ncbi:MAG: replication-associated recombination protein A [Pseudomonadales bacterium]
MFPLPNVEPLAARLRPRVLEEFRGQDHLLAAGRPLAAAAQSGQLHSMIVWGPPGVGKTTLGYLLANGANAHLTALSAVMAGVKDVRSAVAEAKIRLAQGRRTVLFIDEVHRFNKAQQDAFLPFVEDGTVVFIGATTENPSFEVNNALLSRARVYRLRPLDEDALAGVLETALTDCERGLGDAQLRVSQSARARLIAAADTDARRLLNLLELASQLVEQGDVVDDDVLDEVLAGETRRFDKGGDIFYEQISALHKAVRGSSPDASLYWLARMLDGGCDPLYIARRVVRMATEDVGNADPRALTIALDAWDVQQRLGSPEGELALAQAVVYLACAAKSNAVDTAFAKARQQVEASPSYDVPMHLRNAPTRLMKEMGYGDEYRYAHDEPGAYAAGEDYFPEELRGTRYYEPVPRGLEQRIAERLKELRNLDANSTRKRWTPRP